MSTKNTECEGEREREKRPFTLLIQSSNCRFCQSFFFSGFVRGFHIHMVTCCRWEVIMLMPNSINNSINFTYTNSHALRFIFVLTHIALLSDFPRQFLGTSSCFQFFISLNSHIFSPPVFFLSFHGLCILHFYSLFAFLDAKKEPKSDNRIKSYFFPFTPGYMYQNGFFFCLLYICY